MHPIGKTKRLLHDDLPAGWHGSCL
jgi:hypothetical protein